MTVVQRIPLTNEPHQKYTLSILDKSVETTFRYNGTIGIYIMDISVFSDNGNLDRTVNGIPMTSGIELIESFNLEIGKMFAQGNSNETRNQDSNRDNFGINFFVYSVTEIEDNDEV